MSFSNAITWHKSCKHFGNIHRYVLVNNILAMLNFRQILVTARTYFVEPHSHFCWLLWDSGDIPAANKNIRSDDRLRIQSWMLNASSITCPNTISLQISAKYIQAIYPWRFLFSISFVHWCFCSPNAGHWVSLSSCQPHELATCGCRVADSAF